MNINLLLLFLISNLITMILTEMLVRRTHKETVEQIIHVIDCSTTDE